MLVSSAAHPSIAPPSISEHTHFRSSSAIPLTLPCVYATISPYKKASALAPTSAFLDLSLGRSSTSLPTAAALLLPVASEPASEAAPVDCEAVLCASRFDERRAYAVGWVRGESGYVEPATATVAALPGAEGAGEPGGREERGVGGAIAE